MPREESSNPGGVIPARDKVRGFLNASSANEIVFVRGATEAINLVAQSWGRQNLGKDDEIIISWLEHHANIVPWRQLCTQTGAKLRVIPVDDNGEILQAEYGKKAHRAGVLSFVLDGHKTETVGSALNREGSRSSLCAADPAALWPGEQRPSLARALHTCEDIDALVAALHRLARRPVGF
ncbi:MAG: aminotransferase class V-fold PLP-dependent enzyme [Bryobacteraceae bacterium]